MSSITRTVADFENAIKQLPDTIILSFNRKDDNQRITTVTAKMKIDGKTRGVLWNAAGECSLPYMQKRLPQYDLFTEKAENYADINH